MKENDKENDPSARIQSAVQFLKSKFGTAPQIGMILGSGLGGFAETLQNAKSVPYSEIPGGIPSGVLGHKGNLIIGKCALRNIAVLSGRIHGFEGHTPNQVTFLPRVLKAWGVQSFIITNATGSTHRAFAPGTLVVITDQINFTGKTPLLGTELFGGERFPDMSNLFNEEWRTRVLKIVRRNKIAGVKEGVYVGTLGPAYETAAEIRMFRGLGADIVGMSTVWETLALHQMGAKLLGISCVTNFGTGILKEPLAHKDVIDVTKKARARFTTLLQSVIEEYSPL